MNVRGKVSAGIAVVTAFLAFPAAGSAATRYATPAPAGGATCAVDSPCALMTAVSGAGATDEVVVAPGDYTIEGEPLGVPAGVTVRGQAGAPRPLLHGNLGVSSMTLVAADSAGATLRHLTIRNDASSGNALRATGATLDDLFVHAAGAETTAAELGLGATMTNSVVWNSTSAGDAVHIVAAGVSLHNVTAWAAGDGNGIRLDDLVLGATATNTIARAPNAPPGMAADIATGVTPILMTNSNFATTLGTGASGGGNQSGFPALADPGSGNFHQLRGSNTIDAGIPDPASGLTDFDGDARLLGAGTDIGADEFVLQSPLAVTGDAVDITRSGATLTGTVDANGMPTTYRFDYGLTPLYGNSTAPADAGAGGDPVPVAQAITGLEPGSIVHYRLVASNPDGESVGLDRVLILTGIAPDDNAPHITGLTLPSSTTVGEPVQLQVRGRDRNAPINSIKVDFDDGDSFISQSACRLRPPDPAFRDNRAGTFTLPYTFMEPGLHTVEVTLGSGNCGRPGQTTTQTIEILVSPAAKQLARVRASQIPTPTTAGAACKNADLLPTATNRGKVQNATVCVLNYVRRANGMRPFRKNKKLRRAGALHNRYMLRGKFFAHQGPGEPSLGERMRKVKYRGGAGENLGAGAGIPYATARGMVDGWMNSPVHRANILEKAFRTVGVAVAASKPYDPAVPGATYSAEFGTTRR